ncbi:Surface presentation of antigens protein SpaO [Pandoraea iniqua]|uniref:Surface presentation of antigens protein SpaO n=1 Tax=Pandoraea iniqua TaxID=2508288 RepID=A0A5E4YHA1_9BURK|nr:type III secretion system cytoplasmic ring protein SctQ [Pandoraea iniqua]VVE48216.1 Surface presentation of antigens protein SpaO [Pandoraea iniqua]
MMAQALRLSHLSSGEALARSALAHAPKRIALPSSAGPDLCASLVPMPFNSTRAVGPAKAIAWSGAQFYLFGTQTLADYLSTQTFGPSALTGHPAILCEVAFERFMAAITQTLGVLGRGTPALATNATHPPPLPFVYEWQVWPCAESQVIDDGTPAMMRGQLHCDSLGQLIIGGLASSHRALPVKDDARAHDLSVVLALELGCAHLPSHAVRALRPADIVLLEDAAVRQNILTLSVAGKYAWRARMSGNVLTILDGPVNTMISSNAPSLDPSSPSDDDDFDMRDMALDDMRDDVEPVNLDALPITLSFDLGRRQMSVAEVCALGPGSVLDLGRPIARAVRIRSGGMTIGEGELVEIDGQIGVSIVRMVPAGTP